MPAGWQSPQCHWSTGHGSAHTSQVVDDVQLNSTMRLISSTLRSTLLPWLQVLSNVEPPALRRKAATDKLVEKIVKHDSWPIQPDILSPPLLQLTSRKLLWLDLQPVDIKRRRLEQMTSGATVRALFNLWLSSLSLMLAPQSYHQQKILRQNVRQWSIVQPLDMVQRSSTINYNHFTGSWTTVNSHILFEDLTQRSLP